MSSKRFSEMTDDEVRALAGASGTGGGVRANTGDIAEAVAAERSRLFVAIRRALPLDASWRGEALDLISEVWNAPAPVVRQGGGS